MRWVDFQGRAGVQVFDAKVWTDLEQMMRKKEQIRSGRSLSNQRPPHFQALRDVRGLRANAAALAVAA